MARSCWSADTSPIRSRRPGCRSGSGAASWARWLPWVWAAWLVQKGIFSRLGGLPLFALFMITLGLDTIFVSLVGGYFPWSANPKEVGSPWGINIVEVGDWRFPQASLWIIGITVVVVAALALFLRLSKWGLAMHVTALDNEVANILGIRVDRVFALSWMMAGCLAGLAGAFLGTFPRLLEPATHGLALRAIPAAILGGVDSATRHGFGGSGVRGYRGVHGGLRAGLARSELSHHHALYRYVRCPAGASTGISRNP